MYDKEKPMKILFIPFIVFILAACGNKAVSPATTFCDTTCMQDSIKFIDETHIRKPYIYISMANCRPDSIAWSYAGMGVNRKLDFKTLAGTIFPINKQKMYCQFNGIDYAWLLFNNCENGRGYFIKIPFDKTKNISRRSSALNSFDPKYKVEQGLVAYTDRGNMFTEDMTTGKQAMMTFGEMLDIDYDAMHEFIDSINVTQTHMWARVLIGKEWKVIEKDIVLE